MILWTDLEIRGSLFSPAILAIGTMTVYLMCQLDWVKGYPDIWLTMSSGYVCDGVSRQDWHLNQWAQKRTLPSPMWVSLTQSIEGLNKTNKQTNNMQRSRNAPFIFSFCLPVELGQQSSPILRCQFILFLRPSHLDRNSPLAFFGLQLADSRLETCQPL